MRVLAIATIMFAWGCGSAKPAQAPDPAGEPVGGATTDVPSASPSGTATLKDPDEKPPAAPGTACTGLEVDLPEVLSRAACEVGEGRMENDKPRDYKGVLDVKVVPSTPKVAPGGTMELTVTFANKGRGTLPLNFLVNPLPRFEIEVYDKKGKRVDEPPGEHPKWPTGHDDAAPPEKTARVILPENGNGRVHLKWDASRTRWAPDKARGAAQGSPFPRAPAGPLPKGKYTVRVVTPLLGAAEGSERAVSAPKVEIEVGK